VLWELGADVIPIGINPNGFNINDGCGSTNLGLAKETVISSNADLAICLDGDADRVILLDEAGNVADGDQILALLASRWAAIGKLKHNTLVATVMSNLGLEIFLQNSSINLRRTSVGDRYVVEEMRKQDFNLGGEQSGHIVMTDFSTTGDGIMAALQFLSIMKQENKPASSLINQFTPCPQILRNVTCPLDFNPLEIGSVNGTLKSLEAELKGKGRLLIRKSGTEPVIRIMVECEDDVLLDNTVNKIADEILRSIKNY
jgi:phosphoglucosamine mutase